MNNLKKLRLDKGLCQKDLAKMLGVGVSTYSGWENDSYEINFKNLFKLADYFKVSVDFLLDREDQSFFANSKLQISSDREINRLYELMTDHQQKCLVNYARGMLASSSSQTEQNYKLRKNY